jgi:galactokinase/mevalonate kinase-like predicted kinase
MTQAQLRDFTSWLGKRSYKSRVERLGIERIREIARENGKKGGRPKGNGNTKSQTKGG